MKIGFAAAAAFVDAAALALSVGAINLMMPTEAGATTYAGYVSIYGYGNGLQVYQTDLYPFPSLGRLDRVRIDGTVTQVLTANCDACGVAPGTSATPVDAHFAFGSLPILNTTLTGRLDYNPDDADTGTVTRQLDSAVSFSLNRYAYDLSSLIETPEQIDDGQVPFFSMTIDQMKLDQFNVGLGFMEFYGTVSYDYDLTYDEPVAAGIPEPTTLSVMMGGIGMIGAAMRRRKAASRPA